MKFKFTDIFIKRPVLAIVVSLFIFLVGLRSVFVLQLQQFPKMENTVISVTTSYPGASADLVQGFITAPLQQAVAGAEGIDYLTSSSSDGLSTINLYIRLNFDPQQAQTNVMGKVAEVTNILPRESNSPVITKQTGDSMALMYIGFSSVSMNDSAITDYLNRVVQPQLQTIPGVANAQILGGTPFAMRIWFNPERLAAFGVSVDEAIAALTRNNFLSAPGHTQGEFVLFNIQAKTDLNTVDGFNQIIIKQNNNSYVRLKDIAKVELGAQNYDSSILFNGEKAVFIGIFPTPSANSLTVARLVNQMLPDLQKNYPPGLKSKVVHDGTRYIRAAIYEVIKTLLEATLIVIVVIFLFLGSLRTVLIPVITIPLSLVGVCTLMLLMGYSINLLTLLALVLAIGLVVDDAIIVVENTYRHLEEGLSPLQAALKGAREIALPIIAMTITLAAVYAPIGLMTGLTGALFTEFAFTLAFAVIISGVIALTLSPMMCSRFFVASASQGKFVSYVDAKFEALKGFYFRRLHNSLNFYPVTLVFAAIIFGSCFFLFMTTASELAPEEDQSFLFGFASAPDYANLNYLTRYTDLIPRIFDKIPERQDDFIVNGMNGVTSGFAGIILKPWDERTRSTKVIAPLLQQELSQIAGINAVVFSPPALPGGNGGLPVQFVITSTADYVTLNEVVTQLKINAEKSGLFVYTDTDLKYAKPELYVNIDRNKAAEMGLTMQDIGDSLAGLLGGNYVNRFSLEGRSYQVIPQVPDADRLNPEKLKQIYLKTPAGAMVPLSTVVELTTKVLPNSINQFQQLNSVTFSAVPSPGLTLTKCLDYLKHQAETTFPKGVSYDFAGESRQVISEGNKLLLTFFFALVVIYLVLAAQFESFSDPLIILIAVPMSMFGALLPLNIGLSTLNIYSEIGLVTLIGLISKHGILMVEFANQLQKHEKLSIRDAIEKSASIRLRPILMTTASMVVGVIPLLLANGAGAASRFNLGLIIVFGMLIGTFFTLFVVPAIYVVLARRHNSIDG